MKTILVDAINALVNEDASIFVEMQKLLDTYPNRKIVLTGANDEQMEQFGLKQLPYEVFTLKHDPEKSDPSYYIKMLEHFGLQANEVVYFEHNQNAKSSAESVGIVTHFYDEEKRDLQSLKEFLNGNLSDVYAIPVI